MSGRRARGAIRRGAIGRARGLRARRGSALILVLLMTLAVAALALAAIFMSSSAGLLSRFYDRERDYRFAAESALEIQRTRLTRQTIAVPDTGVIQLAAGFKIADASGVPHPTISVNVYAAATGDTTGQFLPTVTLVAVAYDSYGTRHVRRMDLRRESFSRYQLFADEFGSSLTFGPGTVAGRVHTNETWRSGGSAATAGVYLDSVTAVDGFAGTATYGSDTISGVPAVTYPVDSTYPRLDTLATAANLSFTPVSGTSGGTVRGSRLEFVAFDADLDSTITESEGFVRIFDLESGMDTSRLSVPVDASEEYRFFGFLIYAGKPWNDPVVQNQCGAFYYRSGRWQFFPVAVHRTSWARAIINQTGGSNFPSVNNPTMNGLDAYDGPSTIGILSQPTARCFPAGSPFLMPAERKTNQFGVVTGTAADTVPWGVAPGTGTYGGVDTTFTAQSRTCLINTTSATSNGRCVAGTLATLGSWRAFPGTAVTGIADTVRQAAELPYLWPLGGTRNTASRGVVRSTSGPLFVSGVHRGRTTLSVSGDVAIVDQLEQVNEPGDPSVEACTDQLGIVAVGDVLVADNALFRAKRIGSTIFSSLTKHLGGTREVAVHAQLMSLTGTVGTQGANVVAVNNTLLSCPADAGGNSAGGCFKLAGGAVMQTYSQLYDGSNTGLRWAGVPDACAATTRRPPFFPLTNRYTVVRSVEVEASQANTPPKIRTLLLRLKGKTL